MKKFSGIAIAILFVLSSLYPAEATVFTVSVPAPQTTVTLTCSNISEDVTTSLIDPTGRPLNVQDVNCESSCISGGYLGGLSTKPTNGTFFNYVNGCYCLQRSILCTIPPSTTTITFTSSNQLTLALRVSQGIELSSSPLTLNCCSDDNIGPEATRPVSPTSTGSSSTITPIPACPATYTPEPASLTVCTGNNANATCSSLTGHSGQCGTRQGICCISPITP